MSRKSTTLDLVPLPHYCRATGVNYQTAYSALMRGDLPGERVWGRWFVAERAVCGRVREKSPANNPTPTA